MLIIPEEGISHPDFKKLNYNEALDFFVKFDLILENEITELVNQIVEIWISELKKNHAFRETNPLFAYNIKPESLRVVVARIDTPHKNIRLLIQEFQKSPLEIIELFIRKRRFIVSNKNKIKLEHHIEDSRITKLKSSERKFWKEKLVKKLVKTTPKNSTSYQLECETQPMYIKGLIISYGVRKCHSISSNRYAQWIAIYLEKYLKEVFVNQLSLIKKNEVGEEELIKMIYRKKRIGYLLELNHQNFISFYGKWYRVRDYELLQVLREIINLFRLAPIVHWERDEEKYKIQLWENWTY